MPEPLRSIPSRHLGRAVAALALVALLFLGVARVPLEDAAPIDALRAQLAGRLEAAVRIGSVRLDPLAAGGVVVEDLELDGGGWRLSLPRAVWRPELGALLGGEARSLLRASSFTLTLTEDVRDFSLDRLPDLEARLAGGRVVLPGGTALLEDLRVDLRGPAPRLRFELRGRQAGGGRLDLRARRDPAGGGWILEAFPEALALGPIEELLRARLPARTAGPLDPAVGGHWHAHLGAAGEALHRFALEIADAPGGVAGPRLALEARGLLRLAPRPEGGGPRIFEAGSHVVVGGEVRSADELAAYQLSGPVTGRVDLAGPTDGLLLHGALALDGAHLRLGELVRKPCGLPARLRIDSTPGEAGRVTRVAVELGTVRGRALRRGAGPFEGETDWVRLETLPAWLAPARERVRGGLLRVAHLRAASLTDFEADLEFADVALAGRRAPLPLDALAGRGRLTPRGVPAMDVAADVAGVPLRFDLAALFPDGESDARLRFQVRAGEIDLEGLGLAASEDAASWAGPVPGALVAAAEPPVALLRRERESLAGLEVEAGRFEVARLRTGTEVLNDLRIDVNLRALRLGVSRVDFRHRGRRERYAGSIDLNPLVPAIAFAAAPRAP